MENWKTIARFPNFAISDQGNVCNVKTGLVRKLQVRNGYQFTQFYVGKNKKKNFYIHRLVAEAFLDRPRPFKAYNYVNHKSLDKLDNRAENLEWVSQAANIQHYYRTGYVPAYLRSQTS